MQNPLHRFAAAALTITSMIACSAHPSGSSAATEVSSALCEQMQACDARSYLKEFPHDRPNDQSECISTTVSKVDTSKREACTQQQLDTCTADLRALSCADFNATMQASKLPPSCDGC